VTGIANTDPNLGCAGSNCRQSQNIDKESHKGVEISLDSQISEDLWGAISYTYINARISKSQAADAKYVTDTPAHSFYASFKYSPRKWADIMPVLRYESARYTTTNGDDKAASYVVADLKTAFYPIDNLEIGVGVKNMFDEYYYYDKAFPLEGRSYYANIRYNF
jgi:iron complex outermembrane receptor protein